MRAVVHMKYIAGAAVEQRSRLVKWGIRFLVVVMYVAAAGKPTTTADLWPGETRCNSIAQDIRRV